LLSFSPWSQHPIALDPRQGTNIMIEGGEGGAAFLMAARKQRESERRGCGPNIPFKCILKTT
jgi:hypothetical protein